MPILFAIIFLAVVFKGVGLLLGMCAMSNHRAIKCLQNDSIILLMRINPEGKQCH